MLRASSRSALQLLLSSTNPYSSNHDQADLFTVEILVTQNPIDIVEHTIDAGLEAHGARFTPDGGELVPLQVYCRSSDGTILGGMLGNTGNTWLHIWQLWVAESYRGQSLGSKILAAAEREAIQRKCKRAHLETLSFQAVKFYLDRGYEEFGVLPEYVGPYSQHYLRKTLVSDTISRVI